MTVALCLFIEPIAEHTFYLKAITSFYLVKSKNYPQIFKKREKVSKDKIELQSDLDLKVEDLLKET